jgi:pyrroloquinoline quinone (PQQ) biosynthesis protein C
MARSMPHTPARRHTKRRRWRKPKLSIAQILAWADELRQLTGQWPTRKSGRVRGTLDEDWNNLDNNLRQGNRGLLKGDSLARLLWRARGVRNSADPPPLSVHQILAWADAHLKRQAAWPTAESGCVSSDPEENWNALDMSLRTGNRGLPGGSSLARLLARKRGVPNKQDLPRLTIR